MRLSRRSEYGIRALVDLIRQNEARPMSLAALAERNNLPPKFLEQILSTLKRGGIVRTTLGAHGGYGIAADPTTVTVGRVIRLLDGALAPCPASAFATTSAARARTRRRARCATSCSTSATRCWPSSTTRPSPSSPPARAARRSTRTASTPTRSPVAVPDRV